MNGRDRVFAAAEENGWTVRRFEWSAWIQRPGEADVNIEWSATGALTYAFVGPATRWSGTKRAEGVIEYLQKPAPSPKP
jgi:hypothetical protein